MGYARKNIEKIAGYVPGEQPQGLPLIKLNTNENPYPPSPAVAAACAHFNTDLLRLYPEPSARIIREAAAAEFHLPQEQIICGNGSDDLLTIALRTFVGEGEKLAYTEPSYSLYPVLADLQGAQKLPVNLDENFDMPEDAWIKAGDAKLFIFARPNAPTGNSFSKNVVENICRNFKGVVWIDEAYADFAEDNCLDLVDKYPNVVVSRTLSKSYSLAAVRLGIAFSNKDLITEMNKVRDSYNVDMITQYVAAAAIKDSDYMRANTAKIKETRQWLTKQLQALGCNVLPSETNFIFCQPKNDAADIFRKLKEQRYLVRYFNLPRISGFIRITIGTREDMEGFLKVFRELDK